VLQSVERISSCASAGRCGSNVNDAARILYVLFQSGVIGNDLFGLSCQVIGRYVALSLQQLFNLWNRLLVGPGSL
jgi:hypothetical protein